MDYVIICVSAAAASALTLPSGFGLGTVLMPVFALFFPVDLTIALTAVVHLFNNLFKFVLFGKYADKEILMRFGVPAIVGAFLGARMLIVLAGFHPLYAYQLEGRTFYVAPVKVVIGLVLLFFVLLELIPRLREIRFHERFLIPGGALSGFFGGLSGHQGALRSAFLIRSGLSKEAFIATGVVIACLVDFSRLSVYSAYFSTGALGGNVLLLLSAVLSAFLGAFIAQRVVRKVTLQAVRIVVTVMLFLVAIALGAGFI